MDKDQKVDLAIDLVSALVLIGLGVAAAKSAYETFKEAGGVEAVKREIADAKEKLAVAAGTKTPVPADVKRLAEDLVGGTRVTWNTGGLQ